MEKQDVESPNRSDGCNKWFGFGATAVWREPTAIRDNFSLGVAGGRRGCYPYSLFTILDNLSDLELLRRTFPDLRYVFLMRKDKIRQAVSYDRAIRSGVWWSIPTQANCLTEAPGPAIAPHSISHGMTSGLLVCRNSSRTGVVTSRGRESRARGSLRRSGRKL